MDGYGGRGVLPREFVSSATAAGAVTATPTVATDGGEPVETCAQCGREGVSLEDLDVVVEYDFHGGSRRQEAQRYGRVMHGESEGEHLILMTDAEYEKYSKRLLSLEEQGVSNVPERRS